MKNAVLIENLSVCFQDMPLLDNFSLALRCGEKITITGPSGGGKTTLLRCIMGFTPAKKGIIKVLDQVLTPTTIWQLRGKMAYVAQEPELGSGTVRVCLMRPFAYRINAAISYDEEEALHLFSIFRLPASLMDKDMPSLSGGEKQRAALVAGLLLKRPILLLDEVSSALDGVAKEAVRNYLRGRNDLAILSISHDIRDFSLSETVVTIQGNAKGERP